MKGILTTLIFLAFATAATAQINYRIDEIVGGGYYLVEITPAKEAGGQATETPTRFLAKENLIGFVAELRKKANESRIAADRVDAIALKIEQTGNQFFENKQGSIKEGKQ